MERAKVLLWILLVILFLVQPALFTYFLLYGRPLSFLQSIIMIILLSSALVCLKKRHPHAASRIMILSHMAIIWYASFSMIFSGMPLIKKLGLPMGLLGILTIIPLVARKRAFTAILYFAANILLLVLFSFILIRFHPSEIASIRHHSLILTIAFFVTSATTYLIFMSHTRIIKKLLKAQAEIAVKNEELAASNEEFETMNNELVRSHEEIKISEIRYRELYDNALIGMMTVRNPEGDIIKINQSCVLMLGYNDKSEIENRLNIRDLMASAEQFEGLFFELNRNDSVSGAEVQLRKKNDSIIWAEISVGTLAEQEQTEISLIDITARKKAELNLYNLTFYDQLTGLPNSRVFSKRIRAEIIKIGRKRKNALFAVMCLDIDRFKHVNEIYGTNRGGRTPHQGVPDAEKHGPRG